MQYLLYAAVGIGAYLIGGISIANMISRKVIGKNISEVGSGNKGASNMIRNCGWRAGIIVLLFDALKATLAVYIGGLITGDNNGEYIAGIFVIVGHIWPVFNGFKGGKGAASTLGVMAFLIPKALIYIIILLVVMTLIFKTMSLTSFSGLIAMMIFVFTMYKGETGLQITACIIFAITVFCHRENIVRLFKGKEAKVKIAPLDESAEDEQTKQQDSQENE
jgi:acyl phosphate:glycerol-3-phosphate acyltransferase